MRIRARSGDTMWHLSVLFGIPVQLIADSNRDIDPGGIQTGQLLNIPGYVWQEHRVAAGDSFWRIAGQYGISVELLLQSNPGLNPESLAIGQTLLVPRRVTERVVEAQRAYSYAALTEDLARLAEAYPFILQEPMGYSVMGKPIPELRIGSGAQPMHFSGSIHANEWITTSALMQFVNDYALALTAGQDMRGIPTYPLYLDTTLSVVPMVNPDGVDLVVDGLPAEEPYRAEALAINGGSEEFSDWKANIRGVDLNKQFPALWERDAAQGPQQPAPRDFSGTAPLTEPEAQALAALTRRRDYSRVLAFHTQGEVIYWGFRNLEPPESETLAYAFAQASGYTPERFVDSAAGYKDWFIQDWRRPGFTLELGHGVNPLPLSQFPELYEKSFGIMLTALYM